MAPYFANYTLQNEFFWQKMTFLKEILHFLVELFGCIKKKSYLCMLFRGDVSLARVYIRAHEACLERDGEPAESMETFN